VRVNNGENAEFQLRNQGTLREFNSHIVPRPYMLDGSDLTVARLRPGPYVPVHDVMWLTARRDDVTDGSPMT
jgi:hypothetical protein